MGERLFKKLQVTIATTQIEERRKFLVKIFHHLSKTIEETFLSLKRKSSLFATYGDNFNKLLELHLLPT